jgi:phage tail-like protein
VDVNGTRFHLIQGNADWKRCLGDGAAFPWTALAIAADETLTLAPLLPIVLPPRAGAPLDPAQRRGAAIDRLGHAYWIGADERSLYWLPAGTRQVLQLWPRPAPPTPPPAPVFAAATTPLPQATVLRGLAVTSHNYLVAGSVDPAGLLVFDLTSGAMPSLLLLPEGTTFAPFDMAPGPDGGVWVLDRDNNAYWGFDRDFRAGARAPGAASEAPVFQPVEGSPVPPPPAIVPAPFPVATVHPIAIEGLPDGSVLVLDGRGAGKPVNDPSASSDVYRYQLGALVGMSMPLQGVVDVPDDTQGGVSRRLVGVVADDIVYDPATRLLYAVDRFGRQSLAFLVSLTPASATLELQTTYLPMHRFGGRALVAWGAARAAAVSYDVVGKTGGGDPLVRWARLQAIDQQAYARSAVLETPVLDGKARDCEWDGLFLDACIPSGARVTVSSCAANDPDLAAVGPFNPEPVLYLRRSEAEIPFYDTYADRDPRPAGAGTWEFLLQQARGRYLKLRLQLDGDGRCSPELKALRVYYARFSYSRRYLPAAYSDEPVSASFVERLLANPKGFYSDIEAKIAHVGFLFDPRSAPTEDLDWLAGWLGLALDPLWQDIGQRLRPSAAAPTVDDRRRLFIRFATRLYTRRGTADGIRFALHLLLEPCLEALLKRLYLAALTPDPALTEDLQRYGLPAPDPTMTDSEIEDLFTQYLLAPMRPSKVRIVERFMARGGLAVVAGDPTDADADGSIAATAHRFAVLVPETLPADIQAMVSRIVNLEKPAHTDYEVRRYWDYFRVGETRLGFDTILGNDAGFVPMVLGQSALLDGYLAYPPPADAPDRVVLDRDRLGAMPAL